MAIIGGVVGALFGLACAIPAGLILAAGRRFLEPHPHLARIYGGALGGLVLACGPTFTSPRSNGSIAAAFALGAAVGWLNTKYVVTGHKCLAARCLTRRVG
jgi:drug/metabolite transporter (DMT)-like permease